MKATLKLLLISLFTITNVSFAQLNDAIKLRITDPNGHTDETILRLHNSATSNWDDDWDAWKIFTPFPNYPSIYSQSAEDFPVAINSIDFTEKDTTIGIWISTQVVSGIYNLEVEFQGVFTPDIRIGIKDQVTGDQYILENDMSFLFDVTADPINDSERFRIFLSPKPLVDVFENQATIFNLGAQNWSCSLFSETDSQLQNSAVPIDSAVFINLLNGNYYTVATDDFGFIDTTFFTIDFTVVNPNNPLEESTPVEISGNNSNLLIVNDESEAIQLTICHNGESYYLKGEIAKSENITIFTYSLNGTMLSEESYQNTSTLNYEIPTNSNGVNSIIVLAFVGTEKYSFKLIR